MRALSTFNEDKSYPDNIRVRMTPDDGLVDCIMTAVDIDSDFASDKARDESGDDNLIRVRVCRSKWRMIVPDTPLVGYDPDTEITTSDSTVIKQSDLWGDFASEVIREAYRNVAESGCLTTLAINHNGCFKNFIRGYSIVQNGNLYYSVSAGSDTARNLVDQNKQIKKDLLLEVRRQVVAILSDSKKVGEIINRVDTKNKLAFETQFENRANYIDHYRNQIESEEDREMALETMNQWAQILWNTENLEVQLMPTELYIKEMGPQGLYKPAVYDENGELKENAVIYMCISRYGQRTSDNEGIPYTYDELKKTLGHEVAHHQVTEMIRQESDRKNGTLRCYIPDHQHGFILEGLIDHNRKILEETTITWVNASGRLTPIINCPPEEERKPFPIIKFNIDGPEVNIVTGQNEDSSEISLLEAARYLSQHELSLRCDTYHSLKERAINRREGFFNELPKITERAIIYSDIHGVELTYENIGSIVNGICEEMDFDEVGRKIIRDNQISGAIKEQYLALNELRSICNFDLIDYLRETREKLRALYSCIAGSESEYKGKVLSSYLKIDAIIAYELETAKRINFHIRDLIEMHGVIDEAISDPTPEIEEPEATDEKTAEEVAETAEELKEESQEQPVTVPEPVDYEYILSVLKPQMQTTADARVAEIRPEIGRVERLIKSLRKETNENGTWLLILSAVIVALTVALIYTNHTNDKEAEENRAKIEKLEKDLKKLQQNSN